MTTLKAYHGTCDYIDRFDIVGYMGKNTANNGGAIFFTTDVNVANAYSKESFIRQNEYNDNYEPIKDIVTDAINQEHVYSADIDMTNCLDLDITEVYNKEFYKRQHRTDIMDANLINHIVNILQQRQYQRYMEYYDDRTDCIAFEIILPYLEEYDEEQDEYIEKDVYYDVIRVKNCVDSIDEDSHWRPSDIIIVLDENIINDVKLIKGMELNDLLD